MHTLAKRPLNPKILFMLTGDFLRQLRTLRGIKQTVIAKKLGISQQAYSKLEKCKKIDENKEDNLLMILQCKKEDVEHLTKILSRLN